MFNRKSQSTSTKTVYVVVTSKNYVVGSFDVTSAQEGNALAAEARQEHGTVDIHKFESHVARQSWLMRNRA